MSHYTCYLQCENLTSFARFGAQHTATPQRRSDHKTQTLLHNLIPAICEREPSMDMDKIGLESDNRTQILFWLVGLLGRRVAMAGRCLGNTCINTLMHSLTSQVVTFINK